MTKPSPAARIGICIATYRRPRMLATLLKALDRQTFRKVREPHVAVVVIDNDADESARSTVERAAVRARWPLCYGVEPRRGISYARNCGVTAVARECDFVVFVDDDELPRRNWLDELLSVQARENADVVAGPVLPRFDELPPAWVERGRFFVRPRYRTGHPLSVAGAGNALVRSGLLTEQSGPFSPQFALSGAEDTHLFMRLKRLGARMVWADEAVVDERVPKTRLNVRWLLQRAYRGGNGFARCELDVRPGARVRVIRGLKGAARVAQGVALLALAPAYGIGGLVEASSRVCLGLGMLTGVLGYGYDEYRQVHGA